ncbi:MAG: dienelactone hydrolase family protein [Bacteroidetes bacterium]|nr:dienelactone hydrolase family protein [Bacteroidota bacterium]
MDQNLTADSLIHARFMIPANSGETIYCDARFPGIEGDALPVIIFAHGFKGFKNWGSIPYICESLARRGFYTIAMNFTHNGVEGHRQDFTRLDRFEANTFTREVEELQDAVSAVSNGAVPLSVRASERIGIIGHSRGGGISLLEAADDPRVRAVAVWASVASFHRFTERQIDIWRRDGFFESKNMRTGQMMRLGSDLLADLEMNSDQLDITAAAERFGRPLLILHGEQDLSVRIEDGEEIASHARPELTEFVRIPTANHTFGAVHPFEGTNPILEDAISRTAGFFHRHL